MKQVLLCFYFVLRIFLNSLHFKVRYLLCKCFFMALLGSYLNRIRCTCETRITMQGPFIGFGALFGFFIQALFANQRQWVIRKDFSFQEFLRSAYIQINVRADLSVLTVLQFLFHFVRLRYIIM